MNVTHLIRPLFAVLTVVILASSHLAPVASAATPSKVDPRQIAIAPSDLPPGFTLRPDYTKLTEFPNGYGVKFSILLARPETEENLAANPVAVSQAIIRVDTPNFSPEASLVSDRNDFLNQGWQLVDGAPNDYGRLSLIKRGDNNITTYAFGIAKGNVEIVSFVGGRGSVVQLSHAIAVTEISSKKLDQAVAADI